MNVYNYINSKDVRNYLRNINYSFSPAECAYIVGLSKTVNLREKMLAFKEIIHSMPDCIIGGKSLHKFLRRIIRSKKDPINDSDIRFCVFFTDLQFNFPLPFQKGDILISGMYHDPFVFSGEYTDDTYGAFKSGYIWGYWYSDNIGIARISRNFTIALNCERYAVKDNYTSIFCEKRDKTLSLYSAYLKGEINKEVFSEQYKQLSQKITDIELHEFFKE